MVHILIIEDNSSYRESLKEMLLDRFPSAKVEEAENGTEGRQFLKSTLPDLIFIDIRLPDENGLKITKEIKEAHKEIPIIVR